jgi:hypothetical protein
MNEATNNQNSTEQAVNYTDLLAAGDVNPNIQLTGAGKKEKRRALDFYPTPPEVTIALMDFLKLEKMTIWEPACGNNAMVDVLKSYGHDVIATDIQTGHDFFNTNRKANAIITNPPFDCSQRFIEKAISDAPIVAMVLKSQYWHAKSRADLYAKFPPAWILPLTWRPDFLYQERKPGQKSAAPTMEVNWTVWIKGNHSAKYQPLIKPKVPEQRDLFACR